MASKSAEKVAADLGRAGYHGLFLAGDRNVASTIWRGGDNRPGLTEIVASDNFADLERVLASEVLYAYDPAYPPHDRNETLGHVYAQALAMTGSGDRPVVLTGNAWGFMYHRDDLGPLGKHLLEVGPAAVPALTELLGDAAPILYEGSQDATLGNSLRYRVKDAAAYFIGRLTGKPVPFHDEFEARDAEIERLEAALGP